MKKIYMTPDMEVFEMNVHADLLAGSGDLGTGNLPNADIDDVIPGTGIPAEAREMQSLF